MDLGGAEAWLDLTLNQRLLAKGFFHRRQLNGSRVVEHPSEEVIFSIILENWEKTSCDRKSITATTWGR